jgi:hypothetical protein
LVNEKEIYKKHLQKDNPSNIIQEKCKEAQSEKLCASLVFQVLSLGGNSNENRYSKMV